jgi:hypothetical protein
LCGGRNHERPAASSKRDSSTTGRQKPELAAPPETLELECENGQVLALGDRRHGRVREVQVEVVAAATLRGR